MSSPPSQASSPQRATATCYCGAVQLELVSRLILMFDAVEKGGSLGRLTIFDETASRRRPLRQHSRLPLLRLPQSHGYNVCFERKLHNSYPILSYLKQQQKIEEQEPADSKNNEPSNTTPLPPSDHDQNPLPHPHPRPRQAHLLLDECHYWHRQHHD